MQEINDGLNLKFENTGTQTASMKIGWCISPEVRKVLIEKDIQKPKILIVVVDSQNKEKRYLVPAEKTQQLIQFYRAGRHEIHAALVWQGASNLRTLLRPDFEEGEYERNIWNGYLEEDGWVVWEKTKRDGEINELEEKIGRLRRNIKDLQFKLENPDKFDTVEEIKLPVLSLEGASKIKAAEAQLDVLKKTKDSIKQYIKDLEFSADKNDPEKNKTRLEDSEKELVVCEAKLKEVYSTPDPRAEREISQVDNGYLKKFFGFCGYARREINIVGDFFAPEYPPLLKQWVNWGYERAHRDQCQFRGRAILAFTLKPILAMLIVLFRVLSRTLKAFLFTGLLGVRGLQPEDDLYSHNNIRKTWIERNSKGAWRSDGKRLLWELTRPAWTVGMMLVVLLVHGVKLWASDGMSGHFEQLTFFGVLATAIVWMIYLCVGIVTVVTVFISMIRIGEFIGECFHRLLRATKAHFSSKDEEKEPKEKDKRPLLEEPGIQIHMTSRRFESLLCTTETTLGDEDFLSILRKVPVTTVPSLIYDEIKGAVCKPAQR